MTEVEREMTINNKKFIGSYQLSKGFQQFEPDFFLMLNNQIYPTHFNLIQKSKFITRNIASNQRNFNLPSNINGQSFQEALIFIYTSLISFPPKCSLDDLIKISKQLQLSQMERKVYQQIEINFQKFNFFQMYEIGVKYQIKQLNERCEEQLIDFQFDQLDSDHLKLLQLSLQSFTNLIKTYQKLKQNKIIFGLQEQKINKIIQQYEKIHGCIIKIDQNFDFKQSYFNPQNQNILKLKIKKTFPNTSNQIKTSDQKSKINIISLEIPRKNMQMQAEMDFEMQQEIKIEQQQIIIKRNNKIVEQIIDLDYITSPIITFKQLDHKIGFDEWSTQQDDKFMNIDKDGISEKDSQQEQDQDSDLDDDDQIEGKQKCFLQSKITLKTIPSISKHFIL